MTCYQCFALSQLSEASFRDVDKVKQKKNWSSELRIVLWVFVIIIVIIARVHVHVNATKTFFSHVRRF